jgi:hypothetical protein
MRVRAASTSPRRSARHEENPMLAHRFRRVLAWAAIATTILQLALATAVAAASGGGDFPLR